MKNILILIFVLIAATAANAQEFNQDSAYLYAPVQGEITPGSEFLCTILPLDESRDYKAAIELVSKENILGMVSINASLNHSLKLDGRPLVKLKDTKSFILTDSQIWDEYITPNKQQFYVVMKNDKLYKVAYKSHKIRICCYHPFTKGMPIMSLYKDRCGQGAVYLNQFEVLTSNRRKNEDSDEDFLRDASCSYREGESLSQQNLRLRSQITSLLQVEERFSPDKFKIDSSSYAVINKIIGNDESVNLPLCGLLEELIYNIGKIQPLVIVNTITRNKKSQRARKFTVREVYKSQITARIDTLKTSVANKGKCDEVSYCVIKKDSVILYLDTLTNDNCDTIKQVMTVIYEIPDTKASTAAVTQNNTATNSEPRKIEDCQVQPDKTTFLDLSLTYYNRSWASGTAIGFPLSENRRVNNPPTFLVVGNYDIGKKPIRFCLGGSAGSPDKISYTRWRSDTTAAYNTLLELNSGVSLKSKNFSGSVRVGGGLIITPTSGTHTVATIRSNASLKVAKKWLVNGEFLGIAGPLDLSMFRATLLAQYGCGNHKLSVGGNFHWVNGFHPVTLKKLPFGSEIQIRYAYKKAYLDLMLDPIQNALGGGQRNSNNFNSKSRLEYSLRFGFHF